MSIHHLKINKQPFDDLVSGRKTGEVRDCSDRDFKVGDSVELFMTETATGLATESIVRTITRIQRGYGLPDNICVLSYATPTTRHQGELVAWMVEISGADKFFYSKKSAENARRRYEKVFDAERMEPYPLYRHPAEQPAPVAMVLPERSNERDHAGDWTYEAKAWNACLDEVTRLNTK